jgi:HJR/Mrr/RecB family endonuclease
LLEKDLLEEYSKTKKLLEILKDVKSKNEKAIIFVISKSMQLFLQYALKKPLGLDEVSVINGDNNKSSSRKIKLENFQNKEGFNVIILSPLAAGVGLTINEANHVIHLERHWNPAKEDQASDRVYRIGQEKDVFIHHIISRFPDSIDKKSFDQGLNQLIMNKKALSADTLIPTAAVSEKDLVNSIFGNKGSEQTLESVDNMNDKEFENYIKELFGNKGYKSRLTEKYPSEFGADVLAYKGDEIIAIQCKHSKNGARVDKQAILQLHSESKDHYKATKLIAVTNTYFNENAKKLAKLHNVEIIDRETILEI